MSASERCRLRALRLLRLRVLRQLDTGLIVNGEETMADRISNSEAVYLHRSSAWVVGAFAGNRSAAGDGRFVWRDFVLGNRGGKKYCANPPA